LQLMGGAGAIGALASYLIGAQVKSPLQQLRLRSVVSFGLFVLIFAAASLDVFYYNQLLLGAVDALLKFESEHPEIYMSTMISTSVTNRGFLTIYGVYGGILAVLGVYTVDALITYKKAKQ
jgi:hypothetical protein